MLLTTSLLLTLTAATSGQIGLEIADEPSGVVVTAVDPGGPTAAFANVGDVVVSVDRIPVANAEVFQAVLGRLEVGDAVILVLENGRGRLGHRIAIAAPRAPGEVAIIDHTQPTTPTAPTAPAAPTASVARPSPAAAAQAEVTTEKADEPQPYVIDAAGPRVGTTAIGLGFAYDGDFVFGAFRLLSRFTPQVGLDIELHTNASMNFLDIGTRFTFVEREHFAFAARLRLHEEHYAGGDSRLVVLGGLGGGVLASFGTHRVRGTVGLDASVLTIGWARGNPALFGYLGIATRPFIAVEFLAIDSATVYAEFSARTLRFEDSDAATIVEPTFAIGASW